MCFIVSIDKVSIDVIETTAIQNSLLVCTDEEIIGLLFKQNRLMNI
jgi:hypothetical protein